ncbi:peptidoglycan editing factor PgeF [Shewanella schlegeliana]|uniref:Purine nucleoside phosphorylase n=1 Tax=Shewanella schlegeliana TaxID=190308 RepID=A0ABS1T0P8_9GAMM|nr:peptidoglycan editing factor PgeF [Shewanella schlegeliana]MBL4914244.1 peptidoglycan editing factor PgeF [Shewanella schlegeliana]MCL1109531.1 peptidoglycan editing factor PgeF [Shewanella schlegeliana]GIU33711.1 laccase domain protein [Shewanella schlegeliana]
MTAKIENPAWFIPSGVNLAFSTRKGGCSLPPFSSLNLGLHVGDDPQKVLANRQHIEKQLSLPAKPAWLEQIHSIDVIDADNTQVHHADGSYTRSLDQVCVVMTADCLPVLLCDEQGTEVAAVHAGWRGLCDGIIEAAVHKFAHQPSELVAYLGPSIGPNAFEVGSEVKAQFEAKHPQAAKFFTAHIDANGQAKFLADIQGLAEFRLALLGVKRVFKDQRCTVADESHFFSYRRDGITGRMASFIWLNR